MTPTTPSGGLRLSRAITRAGMGQSRQPRRLAHPAVDFAGLELPEAANPACGHRPLGGPGVDDGSGEPPVGSDVICGQPPLGHLGPPRIMARTGQHSRPYPWMSSRVGFIRACGRTCKAPRTTRPGQELPTDFGGLDRTRRGRGAGLRLPGFAGHPRRRCAVSRALRRRAGRVVDQQDRFVALIDALAAQARIAPDDPSTDLAYQRLVNRRDRWMTQA